MDKTHVGWELQYGTALGKTELKSWLDPTRIIEVRYSQFEKVPLKETEWSLSPIQILAMHVFRLCLPDFPL